MKKLLALLFVGCVSVSLVGMDSQSTSEENKKNSRSNNNNKDDLRQNDNTSNKQMKDGLNNLFNKKSVNIVNPQFYAITPDEKKPIHQRLLEKTGAYIIDGTAQHLAQPVVAVVSYPLILAQQKVLEWWFKGELEQKQLSHAQKEYFKELDSTVETYAKNIPKQRETLDYYKKLMKEKGLDTVHKNLKNELDQLNAEFKKSLTPELIQKIQSGKLTPEEIEPLQEFKKKQAKIHEKYKISDEDMQTIALCNHLEESVHNDQFEQIELIAKQNALRKQRLMNAEHAATALEKNK